MDVPGGVQAHQGQVPPPGKAWQRDFFNLVFHTDHGSTYGLTYESTVRLPLASGFHLALAGGMRRGRPTLLLKLEPHQFLRSSILNFQLLPKMSALNLPDDRREVAKVFQGNLGAAPVHARKFLNSAFGKRSKNSSKPLRVILKNAWSFEIQNLCFALLMFPAVLLGNANPHDRRRLLCRLYHRLPHLRPLVITKNFQTRSLKQSTLHRNGRRRRFCSNLKRRGLRPSFHIDRRHGPDRRPCPCGDLGLVAGLAVGLVRIHLHRCGP